MKRNKKVTQIIVCILIIIIFSLPLIPNNQNKYQIDIEQEEKGDSDINNLINYEEIINDLKAQYNNDDVVGILEINDADYIVPIMQGEDNEYYLNHTPDGKSSFMGSIYLDHRVDIDSSKKLLIYGHNSVNIDMPFKILEEYYDKTYYDNHKYVEITTSTTKKKYEIFSVHVETSDFNYMNINFTSNEEYLNHLEKLKSKSIYDTGIELSSKDEILILQTCSGHSDYRNYQKKYLLIVLKRI